MLGLFIEIGLVERPVVTEEYPGGPVRFDFTDAQLVSATAAIAAVVEANRELKPIVIEER